MPKGLTDIQEQRLVSLKLLHGLAANNIAPTSKTLANKLREAGVLISDSELSNLYGRKTAIEESLARHIESAMGVGDRWLEADHRTYLQASARDIELIRTVLTLPTNAKKALAALLEAVRGAA